MVDEKIYIDGILFDMPSGETVTLVYQSPLFSDIDSIVSNRTNSVNFPLTLANRRAIQMAGISGTDYPYKEHTAHYYRDGMLLFSGKAILLSLTEDAVVFSFVWGNNEVFEGLLDTKLSELQENSNLPLRYLRWGTGQDPTYYPDGLLFGINAPQYEHPVVPVSDIMTAIETHTGVTGLAGEFSNFAIPLLTKKTDRTANIAQATNIVQGSILRYGTLPIYGCLGLSSNDADLPQIYMGDGIFDVSDAQTFTLLNTSVLSYAVEFTDERFNVLGDIVIEAVDEDGNNPVTIASIPTTYTDNANTRTFTLPANTEVDVDVSQYSFVRIMLFTAIDGTVNSSLIVGSPNLRLVLDINEEQEAIYNDTNDNVAQFPIYLNLPDWSVGQLLKNLAKLSGKFAYCKVPNRVDFVTLDDVYYARSYAYDWSGRVLGNVQERKFTFGDMAQNNTLKYAEDSTVLGNYDGSIPVRNLTLPQEKELLSVDFAGTDYLVAGRYAGYGIIKLYQYEYDDEGNRSVEYNSSLTPRILQYTDNTKTKVTFIGLSFEDIVASKYATYGRTVYTPQSLSVRLSIEPWELATLDLSTPCYIAELGQYYAIISLNTENNNIVKAELLRLA